MKGELTINRVALSVLALATLPLAADTTATGKASVTLIHPLKITKGDDLSFGGVVCDGKGGVVTLNLDNKIEHKGGVAADRTDQHGNGTFLIEGIEKMNYGIQFNPEIMLDGPHGDHLKVTIHRIRLHNAEDDIKAGGQYTSGFTALPAGGKAELQIAARLEVPAGAAGGTYSKDYNVNVVVP